MKICFEVIMYLLLYNLHDCTFKVENIVFPLTIMLHDSTNLKIVLKLKNKCIFYQTVYDPNKNTLLNFKHKVNIYTYHKPW